MGGNNKASGKNQQHPLYGRAFKLYFQRMSFRNHTGMLWEVKGIGGMGLHIVRSIDGERTIGFPL